MVTMLDHFNRKIIRSNSLTLSPYAKHKNEIVNSFFLNKFSGPFDEYNNNHSSQQGAGKFEIEYAQLVCHIGCSDITD